jgi:hypothetical protein
MRQLIHLALGFGIGAFAIVSIWARVDRRNRLPNPDRAVDRRPPQAKGKYDNEGGDTQ